MKKGIVLLLLFCMVLSSLCGSAAMADAEDIAVLDMQFDLMATNSVPYGVSMQKASAIVIQPDASIANKAVLMKKNASAATMDFPLIATQGNMIFSFDLYLKDLLTDRSVCLCDSNSVCAKIFSVDMDGVITFGDGKRCGKLVPEKNYRIDILYSPVVKRCDVAIDGKWTAEKILITNAESFTKVRVLRFAAGVGGYGSEMVLDNVRCYQGDSVLKDSSFPKQPFNPAVVQAETNGEERRSNAVYINADFNSETTGFAPVSATANPKDTANKIEIAQFPNENDKSLCFMKGGSGDPLADFTLSSFDEATAILEMDFYEGKSDSLSMQIVTFRDPSAVFNQVFSFNSNGVLCVAGQKKAEFQTEQWHHIIAKLNFQKQEIETELDGVTLGDRVKFVAQESEMPTTLRIQLPGSFSGNSKMYFDNVRLYSGYEVKSAEELKTDDTATALTAPVESVQALLQNAAAFTLKLPFVCASGESKTVLNYGAEMVGETAYIPVRALAELLSAKINWQEKPEGFSLQYKDTVSNFQIDQKNCTVNEQPYTMDAPAILSKDCAYLPLSVLSKVFAGAECKLDYKYGLAIVDLDKKQITSKQMKDIYDYMIYTRPSAQQIISDFQSASVSHPRILLTENKLAEIKQNIQTDPYMQQWNKELIADSDALILKPHNYYHLPDGVRLLDISRDVLVRSYTLGLAYRLTGESKYLDYLWGELETVCNFPNWNPSHSLDTAEMMTAVCIGYDWCYSEWSEEQKQLLEQSIMEKGLNTWQIPSAVNNNWNMVLNGSMTVACLTLMDLYPDRCAERVSQCLLGLENAIGEFSPDGAWPEGTDYWGYTVSYLTFYMASMQSALHTDYGYLETNSISRTAYFPSDLQDSIGAFNIGDAGSTKNSSVCSFYFSDYFKNPEITALRLYDMKKYKLASCALDLIFFKPAYASEDVDVPLDSMYRDTEIATFRSSYEDNEALFAAIHGGDNNINHGNLDAGAFVIDALGVRWAKELGPDDYNQKDYFNVENGNRYKLYFCSTQGNNVLALNPLSELGQEQYGFSRIQNFVSKPKGGYAVLDMKDIYGVRATEAKRGLKLDREHSSVTVRDEINLCTPTDVWWFMQTNTSVEILDGGKSAILTSGSKRMYVTLETNLKNAMFSVSGAEPLADSIVRKSVKSLANFKRLQIHAPKANGSFYLSVCFTPVTGDEMLAALQNKTDNKNVPIWDWCFDEGEIHLPSPDSICVNGKEIADFSPNKTSYSMELAFGENTPIVSAESNRCTVTVSQPTSADGVAEIKAIDRENPDNIRYYTVSFKAMPLMGQPEGMGKLKLQKLTVSAEPQKDNCKENIVDGDLSTRWSGEGGAEWMQADLGTVKNIDVITLAFFSGKTRVSYFDIELSENGKSWTKVFVGESSGATDGYESYFLGNKKARYIRINCRGNSLNLWNSYSELEIYGK